MPLQQQSEQCALPNLPKTIALIVLFGLSGGLVWSFHNTEWPAFIAALVIGGFVGVVAGGLVGVHIPPSLGMMAVFGGIFEGIFQGWSRYGYVGAILGAFVGIVAVCVIVMLPIMLTHFVMIVCGIDPLAHLDSPGAAREDVESM
jgi:hypothetical protein